MKWKKSMVFFILHTVFEGDNQEMEKRSFCSGVTSDSFEKDVEKTEEL